MANDHEATIAQLHEWYGERTGVRTKLIFSQRLWHDRLRDYNYDAAALRADADLIIRYLKRELAREKRNLGAFKPQNFLQPDNFDADLAIARLAVTKPQRRAKPEAAPETEATGEWRGPETAEKLRQFRRTLGGLD